MASVIPQSLLNKLEKVYIANARGSQGLPPTGAAYLGGSIGGYRTKGSKNKTQSEYSKFIKDNYEYVRNDLKNQGYKGKALTIATMQVIAEQMNQITNHFAQSERQRDAEQSTLRSPAKKKPRKGTASPNTPPTQLDTDLESSPHQRGLASPPTILNHDDHINDDINTIADSEDAQYTQPSSPSTAMEE
jgi:hypothetical protein